MVSLMPSLRPLQLLQEQAPLQPVKQAFVRASNPENVLAFLKSPELRLFGMAVVAIAIFVIAVHVWAWVKMILDKEEIPSVSFSNKQAHTPPSQSYVPKSLLWHSGRMGVMPNISLADHPSKNAAPTRGESKPTRGGDLP